MKMIPQHTIQFIDSWLELRSKWERIPGFSVSISQHGKTLLDASYGLANLESNESLTPKHQFRIASHSKTFTATAIMQLQEQGKVRIDDVAADYLPWLREHRDTRWGVVTIRELLSHSAGVVRDGDDREYWKLRRDFPELGDLREQVMRSDLAIEPNTRLKYSNIGYSLLGEIIQQESGQTYADFVTENIIVPLGLNSTTPELQESSLYATGYSRENLAGQRFDFPQVATNSLAAATGFCSTAGDLALYWQAQMIGTDTLLSDVSKREMQRLQWQIPNRDRESYGLGFVRNTYGTRQTIGHSGGFPGFITNSAIDVDDAVCVVVLTNADDAMTIPMTRAIFGLIDEFGDTDPDTELLKYEGRFGDVWSAVEFVAGANGLRQIDSNSWWPLDSVAELVKNDDTSFTVSEAGGYEFYGEKVEYAFSDDGSIKFVTIAGSKFYPTIDDDLKPEWK